jgi:hypothetical protein
VRNHIGKLVACLLLLLLMLFAALVWPTRFSYWEQPVRGGEKLLVRTNRFTGRTEFLYPGVGWVTSTLDRYQDLQLATPPGWEVVPSETVQRATK